MGVRARVKGRGARRPALRVAGVIVALVAGSLAATVARASEASVALQLDSTTLAFGVPTTVSGSLVTAPECLADRPVEIQARDAATDWTTLVVTVTDATGTLVPTEVAPDHTGEVRAYVPASDADGTICPEATSEPLGVTVAALVVFDPPITTVRTFACAKLTARVLPAKPGTTVKIQRWTGSAWVDLGHPALGDDSTGTATWCFDGWGALGPRTVRAWWPSQDDLNAEGATPDTTLQVIKAQWMQTIDAAAAGHAVSISVREGGRYLYRRVDTISRVPASNEKLLLSMALLEHVAPTGRIATWAKATEDPSDGIIEGNLWILGHGDPAVGTGKMAILAQRIVDAGVTQIQGRVMGSTGYFARDWWAPGWRDYFPDDVIALPSALTWLGNWAGTDTIGNPELRAARELKRDLKALGVTVTGTAGMGLPPTTGLHALGAFWSETFQTLLTSMNVNSKNFYAEELNKLLAVKTGTKPGTIAGGADAIEAFAASRGITVTSYDGSGLSYSNRATASGIAILLGQAEGEPWGEVLADSLATPGDGTLEGRLSGVPVRAKTGTLDGISALSGYVWLERLQTWAEFSILGANISKSTAVTIEDKVVRTLTNYGR